MSSRATVVVSYWTVVIASVTASFMELIFAGTMWPQITAYATVTTKAIALIFFLLPILNLVFFRLSYGSRLGVAVTVIAIQVAILSF